MRLLSNELFGRTMPVPEFRAEKSIAGLGMSDWDGYARLLAQKFSYTNTYYHAEPRLDITRIDESMAGKYRFVISSDVFEHIPPRGLDDAFRNARRLLQPGGFFLLTVPFLHQPDTREHFPRLHDYRIEEIEGRRVLVNRTIDGEEERFDDLVFHGGEGMTLEMRMFAAKDLKRRLLAAGFRSVEFHGENEAPCGVLWPIDYAIPIVARA
jgi:SAM-dependent methyltransferase